MTRTREELSNTITHLSGVVLFAATLWILIVLAAPESWEWMMGVLFLGVGTLLMYSFSTLYHWTLPGAKKRVMRILDHIGIYIMIACSYTPICIAVVGGWIGWTVFGLLWGVVIAGAIYKITAIGKYPKLSLAAYLTMGWSAVFIAKPVYDSLSTLALSLIVLEGVLYSAGTYFYSHDKKPLFHVIWHLFVLAGTIAHWSAIITILCGY